MQIIERDVNPFVDEWEEKEIFPAHQVFKKFGEAGLLGITRDPGFELKSQTKVKICLNICLFRI